MCDISPRKNTCFFCQSPFHKTKHCDSPLLHEFEASTCAFLGYCAVHAPNPMDGLRYWLTTQALRNRVLIRTFAMVNCGANKPTTISVIVDKLVAYFTPMLHATMVNYALANGLPTLVLTISDTKQTGSSECVICYETHDLTDFVALNCGHTFCNGCTIRTLQNNSHTTAACCALCRAVTTHIECPDVSIQKALEKVAFK